MTPEADHIIQTLRTAMRILGYKNRDIDRTLGMSGGYLSRLFGGVMELRFDHIVKIARAMGLEPQEVFFFAYRQTNRQPTAAARLLEERVDTFAAAAEPAPSAAAPPEPLTAGAPSLGTLFEQELERLMLSTLQRFSASFKDGLGP